MRARIAILGFAASTAVFGSESLEKLLATNPELEAERAFAKGDQRYIVLPICGSAKGEVLPGWPLQYTPAHLEAIEKGKRPFTCAELGPEPGNLAFRRATGYAEAFNRRLLQLAEKTPK